MEGQGRVDPLVVLGQRVRAARREHGWSQDDLAQRSRLHRTYISSIERGQRNVSLSNILGLASALGLDPGELLRGMEAPPRSPRARREPDEHRPQRSDDVQPPDEPGT